MRRRKAKQVIVSSDFERRNLESKLVDECIEELITFDLEMLICSFLVVGLSLVNIDTGNK